jgi:lipoyl(octanoyl) transferase
MVTELRDLGIMDYHQVHDLQRRCVDDQLSGRTADEVVFLTEHPPVFTLGRQGNEAGLIRSRADITADGVEIIHTERGGDITYHGPGQLVLYPIVNLRRRKTSVSDFILLLEDIMLRTAADVGVSARRDRRNRGIWVGDRKVGSVGIRVRHGISYHGLALNVNLHLEPFQWIQPCGLAGVTATSLEEVLQRPVSMRSVKELMQGHVHALLCC